MSNIRSLINATRRDGRNLIDENEGKRVLAEIGITVPRGIVVTNGSQVESACAKLQAPFAVKGMSRDVVHKSDIGAVHLALPDEIAVKKAIDEIKASLNANRARIDGYLIEEMATAGQELVIGGLTDAQFGPVLMVGLGGVFVEIFKDITFRICPINRSDAEAMLDELIAAPMLDGARGQQRIDREAVINALCAIGGKDGLLWQYRDQIAEIDINPLIATPSEAVAADAHIVLNVTENTQSHSFHYKEDTEVCDSFTPLFKPRSIAVVGASASSTNRANTYISQLRDFGFKGAIFPIHPSAKEIEGLRTFASLGKTPEPVDYAYIAIPAARVSDAISAANGNVRFAHVLAAGFAETPGSEHLQKSLVCASQKAGVRLLGPNCNGGYSPRGNLTLTHGASSELGSVGVCTQSGGLGIDIIRRGQERGLRFSGVMTLGNCADLGPADLLEFYLADPETQVIGMYLEGVKEGRRFFELLRRAKAKKPVVILKGGRTALGHKAAVSHTGALAGDRRLWEALSRQTGAVLVDDLETFIDTLLAFQLLKPRIAFPTKRAALFGNGGGTSVLAVDVFAECGIEIEPFGKATIDALAAMKMPPGTSIANPIDAPIGTLRQKDGAVCGEIMKSVYENETFDAFILHINLPVMWSHIDGGDNSIVENMLAAANRIRKAHTDRTHFLLVLRSDGRADIDERKRQCRLIALDSCIPVFDELTNAAAALRGLKHHESFYTINTAG